MKIRSVSLMALTILLTLLLSPGSMLQHRLSSPIGVVPASAAIMPIGAQRQSLEATGQITAVAADLENNSVMFIENVGQWDDGARFQVRGNNSTVWLTDNAVWLTLLDPRDAEQTQPELPTPQPSSPPSTEATRRGNNIRVSFVGANPHPRLEPLGRLDTHISFLVGNDPNGWRSDVPVWSGVRYVDLYPGVDLEMIGRDGQGVWRLVTTDKGSLDQLRMQIEGADKISVDDSGRLSINVPAGRVYGPAVVLTSSLSERHVYAQFCDCM